MLEAFSNVRTPEMARRDSADALAKGRLWPIAADGDLAHLNARQVQTG